ncbi:MAG: bifunctional metallophosphatase/5'-nucleotidase [Oligoflexia bacterium]|nr:bifunctional metallophosphatase/5'-nucleotidase [Oligoflexia bacterium]
MYSFIFYIAKRAMGTVKRSGFFCDSLISLKDHSFVKRHILFILSALLILAFLLVTVGNSGLSSREKTVALRIIYTDYPYKSINSRLLMDGPYHGELGGGMAKVATIIGMLVKQAKEHGMETLVLDSGNTLCAAGCGVDLDLGSTIIRSMNEIGYDVVNIGDKKMTNAHASFPQLLQLLFSEAKFSLLGSGFVEENIRPYHLVNKGGLKIAVIGFSSRRRDFADVISQIRFKQANLAVVLSDIHNYGEELAVLHDFPEIDLVVGGRDHRVNRKHFYSINGRHLLKSPRNFEYVGQYDIIYDNRLKKIAKRKVKFIPVVAVNDNRRILSLVEGYNNSIKDSLFNHCLGKSLVNMPHRQLNESVIGDFVTDVMVEKTHSDMAFVSSATLLPVVAGPITINSITQSIPHDDMVVVVDLYGRQIWDLFVKIYDQIPDIDVLQFSGIQIKYDLSLPRGKRIIDIVHKGKTLDLLKRYRVCLSEFLYKDGEFFNAFFRGENPVYHTSKIRAMVIAKIKEQREIYAAIDHRMQEVRVARRDASRDRFCTGAGTAIRRYVSCDDCKVTNNN